MQPTTLEGGLNERNVQRRAHWIWRDRATPLTAGATADFALDRNLFVQFRRTFRLTIAPTAAKARVSADGRYKLYVNGKYAGRGPARCDPLFQYYDVHDLAPSLRRGLNVVAILVHSYGRDMSWYELPRAHWSRLFGCGGLFFQCDVLTEDRVVIIDSDTDWRCMVTEAWAQDTPAGAVGFVEVYDARKALEGWDQPEFDDSGWARPVILASPGFGRAPEVVPFPHLVERDIPALVEERRDAVRVLGVGELAVEDAGDLLGLAERGPPEPWSQCAVNNLDALLTADGATEVRLAPGRAATLVVDFGQDVAGYPALEVEGPAGAVVDISYAERLREDGRTPVQRPSEITSQNVHRYVMREGLQTWEKFERAGFRYLQLTLSPAPAAPRAPVLVRRAGLTFTSYPVGERGAFSCSDEVLTRLWRAGAYTLQLCMQDGFEDCPSREQRQWVGDAYVEMLVNFACCGDMALSRKFLRQVAQSQRRDGMTQMATPGDIAARWPLYIVDYCLYWIMAAGEYVLHTGDRALVTELFPSIARAIAWFERYIRDDGLLTEPPGWIFIDWAEVDRRGACAALNALLVQALNHAATLAGYEGAWRLADRWRALARSVSATLNDRLWDEERGVYVDALLADGQSRRVSQHSSTALIAYGIAPRGRWERTLAYVMDPARLVATSTGAPDLRGASFDEERQVVLAQPFFMHHVHRALASADRVDQLLDNIRAHWSPMLGGDGTGAFWEHWHGQESRCHAWSATPTYDLSREVLGIRPVRPGFEKFAIQPSTGGLLWAEGRYPSVKGDIPISWRRERGVFHLEFEAPEGSEAELVLPPDARSPKVNGRAHAAALNTSGRLTLGPLRPGRWSVEAIIED